MDCMLSEERVNDLAEVVYRLALGGPIRLQFREAIRRFFAPPPGSVRVEVFVAIEDDGTPYADPVRAAVQGCNGDTHRCTALVFIPPVPPTPVVEVVQ